jgi:hypothetical protein
MANGTLAASQFEMLSQSGTGITTIVPPATNTNRTLTLPDNTGTVITTASTFAGTGPAFSAYQSSTQSVATATFTKIQLQAEEFDTASCFDSTTNYRFTPNVAGYYQVSGCVGYALSAKIVLTSVYKNGTIFKRGVQSGAAADSGWFSTVSVLVYLNGSTDYVELYGYQDRGVSNNTSNAAELTYFQAFLARSA